MTILKVTQDIVFPTTVAQNVFWLTASPDVGIADQAQVLTDVSLWLKTMYEQMGSQLSDSIDYEGYRVDEVDPATGKETYYVDGNALITAPTGATDYGAAGLAGQINGYVLGSGHGPRKYLAGLKEASLTSDIISGPALADMADFAADWLAGPTDGSITWVSGMWSRTDLSFYGLVAMLVKSGIAYQRRRKPGVGMT